jgi:putative membrane protein
MRLMSSLLADMYLWVKSFHVMAVIAWMAGLFYLPRLFVYHAERSELGQDMDELFQTMELKLYRVIMGPAAIAAWVFGLALVMTPGIVDWSEIWPWTKAASVLAMTWFHHWLGARRKDFASGRNRLTGRQYRMMNEVPTVLMLVIVLSVIVRF